MISLNKINKSTKENLESAKMYSVLLLQKKRSGKEGPKRGAKRGGHVRGSNNPNDRVNNRTKFIKKGDRNDRDRNDRGRNDRFRGRDRRDTNNNDRRRDRPERRSKSPEQVQQKGRTLKVMGLHPDFTN